MTVLDPHWHTPEWLAAKWGKSVRSIQYWCSNGFLVQCGFKVVQVAGGMGRGGIRWFVYVPDEDPYELNLAATQPKVDSPAREAAHSPA